MSSITNEQKYDRQLRLWASNGQSSIESSHVCLINASVVGCEILKNLVLPNVGKFTIIDNELVDEIDLASNFYLEENQLHESRGKSTAKILNELNTSVQGHWEPRPLSQLFEDDQYWAQFSLVAVTNEFKMDKPTISRLAKTLFSLNIPLLIANSCGFFGSIQIVQRERTIFEVHATELPDLRIDCPWDELSSYVASLSIDTLSLEAYKDIPFSVLLTHYRAKFISQFGKPPVRKDFKPFLEKQVAHLRYANLDNVEELISKYWRGTTKTTIPSNVKDLFAKLGDNFNKSPFWVLVEALQKFVETLGVLPVPGNLLDMASSTERYLELQRIFQKKAQLDRETIKQYITDNKSFVINDDLIELFCKNCQYLVLQQGSSVDASIEAIEKQAAQNDTGSAILVCFRELGKFYARHGRFPDESHEIDGLEMVKKLWSELIRSRGCELVHTSSLIGGIGGQEALKLIINQYVPLDNVLVYDGIQSSLTRWKI